MVSIEFQTKPHLVRIKQSDGSFVMGSPDPERCYSGQIDPNGEWYFQVCQSVEAHADQDGFSPLDK